MHQNLVLIIKASALQVFAFELIAIVVEFGTQGLPQEVSTDGSKLVLALYLVPGPNAHRLHSSSFWRFIFRIL